MRGGARRVVPGARCAKKCCAAIVAGPLLASLCIFMSSDQTKAAAGHAGGARKVPNWMIATAVLNGDTAAVEAWLDSSELLSGRWGPS